MSIIRQSTAEPLVFGVLKSFSFLQQKLDRPGITHVLFVTRAIDDLISAKQPTGEKLAPWLEQLCQGVLWADCDWKNCNHYYHPKLERGMWLFSNAAKECSLYFSAARESWKEGKLKEAAFFLGAAVHLAQDVCVPFHTIPQLLIGHRMFEEYAEKHARRFLDYTVLGPEGASDVEKTVKENSLFSSAYLPELLKHGKCAYDKVLEVVTPQALWTTRQIFSKFIQDVA